MFQGAGQDARERSHRGSIDQPPATPGALTVFAAEVYTVRVAFRLEGALPVDPRLLEILICPACHGDVRPVDEDRGLECQACGRIYPVRDEIPVMLVEEATPPTREPGG